MLCQAAEALPKGFRLGVVEGWRPPYIQRRMHMTIVDRIQKEHPEWSQAHVLRTANRFSAPLNDRVPPPHTTGGAVDVALLDDKLNRVEMMAPYARRDRRAFLSAASGLTEEAERNRIILAEAMSVGGLTNYPSEYWHWSYGDQGWAYRGGKKNAIYAAIEPPGWTPNERDSIPVPFKYRDET